MKLDKIEIKILEFPPNARYKDGVVPPRASPYLAVSADLPVYR